MNKEIKKIHYAWIIMIACFILQAATTGLFLNCSGLYIPQIVKEFGFSNGAFALTVTIRTLANAASMMFCARIFNRNSFKLIYILSAIVCSLCFGLQIYFTSLWMWYVSNAILGFAMGFIMTIPLNLMLQNWFKSRQGFALGVAMTGSGVMGIIMNPISSQIITRFGWRSGIMVLSACALIMIIPTVLFITKWDPESMGLEAYNENVEVKKEEKENHYPSLVLSGTLVVIIFYCLSQFNQSISIYIDSLGLSVVFAGTMSMVMMMGNVFGKLLIGYLADRIGTMNIFIITTAGIIYAFVTFSFFPKEALLLVAGLFYGLCMSAASLSPGLVSMELLSGEERKILMGKITSYATLVCALFFPLISYSYDIFNSFIPIYIVSIIISIYIIWLMYKIKKGTNKKISE